MAYTHFKKLAGILSIAVGKKGNEKEVIDVNGTLVGGINTPIITINGSAGQKACLTNGLTLITGGTGIADLTLGAPKVGARVIIRINTLTSGNVVITTASGVTFNGTNNTATLDAVNEALELVYKSPTEYAIALNVGGVALSSV